MVLSLVKNQCSMIKINCNASDLSWSCREMGLQSTFSQPGLKMRWAGVPVVTT